MTQTISLHGRVMCVTTVPYSDGIVTAMKKAGYRVKTQEIVAAKKHKGERP